MHFTSVDLPAPFSPSKAWKVPAGMLIDTSSRAVKAPNRMVMPSVSIPTPLPGCGRAVSRIVFTSAFPLHNDGDGSTAGWPLMFGAT